MQTDSFDLTPSQTASHRLSTGWLMLALSALVGAGLVVILIILARTPIIHNLIPWTGSFRTALVIHVDLSVLVWFLSFAGLLASLTLGAQSPLWTGLGKVGLGVALSGTLILTLSPFLGEDAPFMNNYVPVLNNSAFFLGLFLFAGGVLLLTLLTLLNRRPASGHGELSLRFGLLSALLILLLALGLLLWSWFSLRAVTPHDEHYFELLFWGGGHLLQFTHVQLQMLAWLWLGSLAVLPGLPTPRLAIFLFTLGALPALFGPVIHYLYPVESGEYRFAFTDLMIYGGGIASIPLSVMLGWSLWRGGGATTTPEQGSARLALQLSLLLFLFGSVIGAMIQGINVTIPAHYHGAIGSITLAYMGLTYHLLPGFGFRRPSPRWSNIQLVLYSVGSVLHVIGLAWSGGHNVPRKTAGAAQGLQTLADKIPMWVMGLGGMIAVLGGILFLVLAVRSLRQGRVSRV
ncbi:MAG: cbb3-type cytochrome c oxidase subunit I [Magnetococcales bacterium]|nr:cbb3-type cytochrome c oxidase subunit I [Magnetococcales bacterium]